MGPAGRVTAVVAAMAMALAACGGGSSAGGSPAPVSGTAPATATATAAFYLTTPDRSAVVARQADLGFQPGAASGGTVIHVDPDTTYQSMLGFGAAFTDASIDVLTRRLDADARAALLAELFGPTGLRLGYARLTIGASDFSLSHYTYDDLAAGQSDDALARFSVASAEAALIPTLLQARALNPQLRFMASPWSAPAWMKTGGSLVGGGLRTDRHAAYAAYLSRYLQAFAADGVPIDAISIANEPAYAPADYPGMLIPAAQRAGFIGGHLGPRLRADGLGTTILEWDHNWDAPEQPLAVLADATARAYIGGTAWHCYAGEPAAQSTVHDAYPAVDVYFSECTGGGWAPDWASGFEWNIRNLVIGATRNWARTVLWWNLALDENGGPHTGGCSNCRPVVSIDAGGAVTRNLEYDVLAQVSPFVRPGAVRIATDSGLGGLETVGFRNADDGTIAVIAINTASTAVGFQFSYLGQALPCTLPAGATATLVWK